jgi:hypothetical protein
MRAIPFGASAADYQLSCKRLDAQGARNPPLPFEPWAFQKAVWDEFDAVGVKAVLTDSFFVGSERDGRSVKAVRALGPSGALHVKAKHFIDCTAEIHLAREAGCQFSLGAEAKAAYGEIHAPEKADPSALNQMNWCYRVRPNAKVPDAFEKAPFPKEAMRPSRFEVALPNGDVLVNPCGMLSADPRKPEEFAASVKRAWLLAFELHRWTVQEGGCPARALIGLAPQIGVREGFRLVGRHVLTETEILSGKRSASDAASCDHPLDLHGFLHQELERPYGIPFGCLQTKEFDNLLVACRGSSFSHIAASSCRLGRTMLTLGEAAGKAAAKAALSGKLPEAFA